MKKITKLVVGFGLSLAVVMGSSIGSARAQSFNAVSHLHQIKVLKEKILLGTHEGLYELSGSNSMKKLGTEQFDVMGLAVLGGKIFASGHPMAGLKSPKPIGLVSSNDLGKSWKQISLGGKVDFHLLEGANSELYGADSQSGNLMYSADSGKKWKSLGTNAYSEIAVSPKNRGMAIALKGSNLWLTENSFNATVPIKSGIKLSQIEWTKSGLFGLSGSTLYKSTNLGKTWSKLTTFIGKPGILGASENLMIVTVGSDFYKSANSGRSFKKVS
ncbi:MAG: hypothetical protein RLY76_963 [Actinomycetota bacterium]|jgi:photosystem II stability/assembly factor-like uncharacterized protein